MRPDSHQRYAIGAFELRRDGIDAGNRGVVLVWTSHDTAMSRIRSQKIPIPGWRSAIVEIIVCRTVMEPVLMDGKSCPSPTYAFKVRAGWNRVFVLRSDGHQSVNIDISVLATGDEADLSRFSARCDIVRLGFIPEREILQEPYQCRLGRGLLEKYPTRDNTRRLHLGTRSSSQSSIHCTRSCGVRRR